MAEHIEGVAPTLSIGERQITATELARISSEEVSRAESLGRLAEEALGRAVSRPDTMSTLDTARAEVMASSLGEVGDLKGDFVSGVEREGSASASDADASVDAQQQTEERIRSLYLDLTNYQIAWKIAQRMQQDITQLLRG